MGGDDLMGVERGWSVSSFRLSPCFHEEFLLFSCDQAMPLTLVAYLFNSHKWINFGYLNGSLWK